MINEIILMATVIMPFGPKSGLSVEFVALSLQIAVWKFYQVLSRA